MADATGLPYASKVTATDAQATIDDGLFERFPKPIVILGQHVDESIRLKQQLMAEIAHWTHRWSHS